MSKSKQGTGLAPFLWALGFAAVGQLLVWRSDFEFGRQLSAKLWPEIVGWLAFAWGGWLLKKSWAATGGEIEAQKGKTRLPLLWEGLVVALLLALSLFVRLYDLNNYPNAGFRDEGENGNVSIQIMNGEVVDGTDTRLPVYVEYNTQNATGYFYPTALFFKVFGISITSERYVSVFFGALSVLAFYALARWMFGIPLGVFLGFALALLRWHINFSRVGFLGIMTLFLEIPVFYFLLRGLKESSGPALKKIKPGPFGVAVGLTVLRGLVPDWGGWGNLLGLAMGVPFLIFAWKARNDRRARLLMLAALALALAMYSYIAARLLVVMVAAVLLRAVFIGKDGLDGKSSGRLKALLLIACVGLAFLVGGSALAQGGFKLLGKLILLASFLGFAGLLYSKRSLFKDWLKPLGLALGLGLVVAGPLYAYSISHWSEINARSDRVSIYNDREYDARPWGIKLVEEIPLTLGMVNVRGDGNPRHNLPGEIMVNPVWAALFGLAIFYLIFRYKDERSWLALVLWQMSLLAGYLSIEAPQAYRTIGAIPAVLIGIGLVLERGLVATRRYLGRDWAMAAVPVLLGLLVLGGAYELNTYFVRQPLHPGVWAEFSAGEFLMGKELKADQAAGPTRGLVRPDWADSYTFRFMTYPERNFEYFDLARDLPVRGAVPGERYLYILGTSQLPLLPMLHYYYPKGVYHEEKHKITGELLYWSYLISPEDVAGGANFHGGLKANYYEDISNDPAKPELGPHWAKIHLRKSQVDPFLLFDWTVSPVPGYFSADWEGTLRVPQAGHYKFWLDCNSYSSLEIDGRKVCEQPFMPPERGPMAGDRDLSAGSHSIRVRYYEARHYSRMELWWQKPGSDKEVLPAQYLVP